MDTVVHTENDKYVGRTQFSSGLLKDAITLSVEEVSGVARLGKKVFSDKVKGRGIKIYAAEDGRDLCVDAEICIEYGYTAADVSYRVQEAVINTARQLTDRRIQRVNVFICGTKYRKVEDEPDNK